MFVLSMRYHTCGVQYILCFVFVVFVFVLWAVSLDCPFFIDPVDPVVFSNVY